jgi:glucose 1-dehydrogenase
MSLKLSGKKAVVTGAARGIGRGCALALAREGADVAINDRTETAELRSVQAEIEALGRRAVLVAGDAFARESCERIAAGAIDGLGRLDILVNVPAYSRRSMFLDCPPELVNRTLEGTLTSAFWMSQLVARHMVARGGRGKIIFMSSVLARMVHVGCAPYAAAKAGLNQLAFTIAAELARHRINVNVIEPGWIDTPGEREAFGDAAIAEHAPTMPWGRLGTPDDIGHAAAFLSSDEADYVTGTVLRVDGGYWLQQKAPTVTSA